MGEKPGRGRGRGREKATSQGRALHATMQRVKVYRLEDNGKWKGQGMGHVTIDYMEGSNELVLAVLDAWDNDILLLHNITPDDIYRKHETIISWRDPEKGLELALSFEGPVECSDTWENMCNIREDLQSEILRHKSSSVNDELKELCPLELFSSKRKKYSQPLPLELSSLLTTLKNIEKMLQRGMTAKTRVTDSISKYQEGVALQQVRNMAPPMTLLDLPSEMLEEVVRRLPCRADRARLRCCSRFWRDSIKNSSEPLQLPWLLFPSTAELLYYSVTGQRFGRYRPIPVEVQNGQFAGSSDGDWIFLVSENPCKQVLFHMFTGWSISLPSKMMIHCCPVDVTVTSAVLSGDPFAEAFIVTAIVDIGEGLNKRAAFWQENRHFWGDCGDLAMQRAELLAEEPYVPLDTELVDLVQINGSFWYLTSEEELARLIPVEDCNGQVRMVAKGLKMQMRDDFEPHEDLDEEVFDKGEGALTWRYLIESSGQPVMVLRTIEGCWTEGVRLFRLQSDSDKNRWEEIFESPSETFFVGHGCSRSYRTGQELQVYFFHDRITRLGGRNLFWRTDSGIATQIGVQPWPVLWWDGVPVAAISDRAPPTWLLH